MQLPVMMDDTLAKLQNKNWSTIKIRGIFFSLAAAGGGAVGVYTHCNIQKY